MNRLLQLHSEDTIRDVFTFAHASSFWVAYVHTACYLEKKFDTLNLQRLKPQEEQKKAHEKSYKSASGEQPKGNIQPSDTKFQPSRVLRGSNDNSERPVLQEVGNE
jgi:hypothetical protein